MSRLETDVRAVAELYGVAIGPDAMTEYLEACEPFDSDAVRAALVLHLRDTRQGQWFPWPPTLLAHIQNESATNRRTTH